MYLDDDSYLNVPRLVSLLEAPAQEVASGWMSSVEDSGWKCIHVRNSTLRWRTCRIAPEINARHGQRLTNQSTSGTQLSISCNGLHHGDRAGHAGYSYLQHVPPELLLWLQQAMELPHRSCHVDSDDTMMQLEASSGSLAQLGSRIWVTEFR